MNITNLVYNVNKALFKIELPDNTFSGFIFEYCVSCYSSIGNKMITRTGNVPVAVMHSRLLFRCNVSTSPNVQGTLDGVISFQLTGAWSDGYMTISVLFTNTLFTPQTIQMRWSVRNYSPKPVILLV